MDWACRGGSAGRGKNDILSGARGKVRCVEGEGRKVS